MTPPHRVVGDITERTVTIGLEQPYPAAELVVNVNGATEAFPVSSLLYITDPNGVVLSVRAKSPARTYHINYVPIGEDQPPRWVRDIADDHNLTMWTDPAEVAQ